MQSLSLSSVLGLTRRSLFALTLPLLTGAVLAQGYPNKVIKLIVPFPAGGPTDTASRIIGQKLGERLKQPVVIENRAGASGSIAAAAVAKSAPDGYTLMMLATPTLLAPHLYTKAGYDAALPHIQSGKLRAIAVGSPRRVNSIPNVKTVAEQGFSGFDAVSWGGLLAPAGTPRDILTRLSEEVKQILAEKDVQEKLEHAGTFAVYQGPDQMATRVRQDYDKWGKVIRDKGISAE